MDNSTQIFFQSIISLSLTYFLHSTILISAVWLLHRTCRISSHALRERLWKMAAVLGLVTAPLQLWLGSSIPNLTIPIQLASGVLHPTQRAATTGGALASDAQSELGPCDTQRNALRRSSPTTRTSSAEAHNGTSVVRDTISEPLPGDRFTRTDSHPASFPLGNVWDASPAPAASADATSHTAAHREEFRHSANLGNTTVVTSSPSTQAALGPPQDATPTTKEDQASQWRTKFVTLLGVASLALVVFGFLILAAQSVLLARRFSNAQLMTSGPPRRALDRLLTRCHVEREVRLITSEHCSEPLSFGLLRWTIAFPPGMEGQLDKNELRGLLAHELAHLTRGDIRWLWIGRLLCTCLAFQPLNCIARRRWQQAAEFCCDDWAVRQGLTPLTMARCLTRVSQWRLDGPDRPMALAATGGKRSVVVQRVERLVQSSTSADRWASHWRQRCLVAASLLIAAAVTWGAPGFAFSVDQVGISAGPGNREQHKDNTKSATTTDVDDRWELLDDQLAGLELDFQRAERLLQDVPMDQNLQDATRVLRIRIDELRQRRNNFEELDRT